MNLDKYLVVSGIPGVHKIVSTRSNGILFEDSNEGRTRFVAIRQNSVTPLSTIGMYVDTTEGQDTVPLGDIFQKMLDAIDTTPVVSADANSTDLRAYFTTVVPEHDQHRVHISDIKKCVKWFTYMLNKGLFEAIKADQAKLDAVAETVTAEAEAIKGDGGNEVAVETLEKAPKKSAKKKTDDAA
jgi:hypothetical protein